MQSIRGGRALAEPPQPQCRFIPARSASTNSVGKVRRRSVHVSEAEDGERIEAERVKSRRRRTTFRAGIVGDDPDEPFSDNEESGSEHDGSPAKFVHKLAKIPIPQRTTRPATSAQSPPATGPGGHQAVSKRKINSPQLAQQAMKMGLSPSQAVTAAMSGGSRMRVSVIGARHQSAALGDLQSPMRIRRLDRSCSLTETGEELRLSRSVFKATGAASQLQLLFSHPSATSPLLGPVVGGQHRNRHRAQFC